MPQRIEYSEKDDKFRLIGSGTRFGSTINLGKIVHCVPCTRPWKTGENKRYVTHPQCVVFEVTDERNALERVLFHFAHFKKQAERIDENRYRVTVEYDLDDETEIVIRILSFGPMIKVTEPQAFVDQMKSRLTAQKSCGL